mmetsp:Transcript_11366/g.12871  ORF Transcript_11366/g.12871 Transcript_11366/m.12871 type:complete len:216 (+) Transcript_11366:122-769(+)
MMMRLVILLIALILTATSGFQQRKLPSTRKSASITRAHRMNTVIDAPTKEDLERKVGRRSTGNEDDGDYNFLGDSEENIQDAIRKQGPLEWLEDNPEELRDMEDPFHILLLDQTFAKPKITVDYVATNIQYVITGMPLNDATEHSQFCYDHGMSCLGVWPREECLKLGRQLQLRDIVCRVTPYVVGGNRAWQVSKDGNEENVGGYIDAESSQDYE